MTIRYVGMGGSDANDGLSWATRKLTLNGVEDTPVVAGDTVYVGAGTYREQLTVDVSGSPGSPVAYIGDYDGSHTDGIGGVVRITGSLDDSSSRNVICISANTKDYRTFIGFSFDSSSSENINIVEVNHFIIENCIIVSSGIRAIKILGDSANNTIRNCFVIGGRAWTINIEHSSELDDVNTIVENCIIISGESGVVTARVGGVVVRNCLIMCAQNGGVRISIVPSAGQTTTVNNCIITSCNIGVYSPSAGYLIEDYNNFVRNTTDRSNVSVGAHSVSHPFLLDTRWFHEMVKGGDLVTPFDLPSYSKLINVAGINPSITDMRGTGKIGAEREWGPLEYDPDLKTEAGDNGGGSGISRSRVLGGVG